MVVTERELKQAEGRMQRLRQGGYAVAARYDHHSSRVIVSFNTGVQIAFPVTLVEGLTGATPEELAEIEISPAGVGLHWPKLDADVYVPALLHGIFGSKRWMAAQLGQAGGRARSAAKAGAARKNGRKGGRPRKIASE